MLMRSLIRLSKNPAALDAIPLLDRWIAEDPDPMVRFRAIEARGLIAVEQEDKTCPLSVAQALLDPDWDVRSSANSLAGLCERFPPPVASVFLTAANHDDSEIRSAAVTLLGSVPRNEKVRSALDKARDDPDFWVRHNAQCAWFKLTADWESFVLHALRINGEEVLPLPPDSSEKAKRNQVAANLMRLGAFWKVAQDGEKRPAETAGLIIRCLSDKEIVRQRGAIEAIRFLAESANDARQLAGKPPDPDLGGNDPVDAPELIAKLAEADVAGILARLKGDGGAVSAAAAKALEKWKAILGMD